MANWRELVFLKMCKKGSLMTRIRIPLDPRFYCMAPFAIMFLVVFAWEKYPEIVILCIVVSIVIAIGAIVVVRNRKIIKQKIEQKKEELIDNRLRPKSTICDLCFNPLEGDKCPSCGALKCRNCGEMNWHAARTCKSCGISLP